VERCECHREREQALGSFHGGVWFLMEGKQAGNAEKCRKCN
jgi:hypothetical protein